MYVVTLHLKTTRADEIEINRRYHALSHIHNTLVSHAKKLIIRLEHDNEYQSCPTNESIRKINEAMFWVLKPVKKVQAVQTSAAPLESNTQCMKL